MLPTVLPQLVFPKIRQRLHSMQVGIYDLQILQVIKRKDQSLFILNTEHSMRRNHKGEKIIPWNTELQTKVKYI